MDDRAGFATIPIAVGETGWPTEGATGASASNACYYNNGLISRITRGTPKVKGPIKMFLFEAFDELRKPTGSGAMQGE